MNDIIIPNHIAVILDGNRRWAKQKDMKAWKGHKEGCQRLEDFLDWCLELNVPQVSAYVLSTENLKKIYLCHHF